MVGNIENMGFIYEMNFDELVKSEEFPFGVIPSRIESEMTAKPESNVLQNLWLTWTRAAVYPALDAGPG
jgi:hypothetical protein